VRECLKIKTHAPPPAGYDARVLVEPPKRAASGQR